MNTPDQNTSHQRQKIYEDLQRENCVLAIQNSTTTEDGKTGWINLSNTFKFRNNFSKDQFTSGILKTITLPGNKKTSTVTFVTKLEGDLYFRNVEKKYQPIKFFESYPINYRTPNKSLWQKATYLRVLCLLTDMSVDETSLIMYLKY